MIIFAFSLSITQSNPSHQQFIIQYPSTVQRHRDEAHSILHCSLIRNDDFAKRMLPLPATMAADAVVVVVGRAFRFSLASQVNGCSADADAETHFHPYYRSDQQS
jgi:hypothetical protein